MTQNASNALPFADQRILITGAGGGLGSGLVKAFQAQGATVEGADQTLAAMAHLGLAARHVFNLLEQDDVEAFATSLSESENLPDVLINNAGWTRAEIMSDLTPANIYKEVNLNLTGVITLTSLLANAMAKRGRGVIVFISSINALLHYGNPAYATAKAGVDAFARALAVEYGRYGIRANAVCPGSIRTPAWDHRFARDPTIPKKLARIYPLGRIVEPEEVIAAVVFLASAQASGISGVSLAVDAGLSAGNRSFLENILEDGRG